MSLPVGVYVSPEEYLRRERAAERRSEYHAGRIFAMAGASRAHTTLADNLTALLWNHVRGGPCQVFSRDQRVKVESSGLYAYPDVLVVCGEQLWDPADADTLTNPTVLIEVLSSSTERYDRGEKFEFYKGLPSLREYLLISQDRPRVEARIRRGAEWIEVASDGIDATARVEALDCDLPLRELYERVPLPAMGPSEVIT
jgi:Uma2 family endonuclease